MDVQHFEAQGWGCQYLENCCTVLAFACSAQSHALPPHTKANILWHSKELTVAVPVRPSNSEHCFLPQANDRVQLINIEYGKMFHVYFNTKGKGKGEVVPIHAIKACGGR